MAGRLTPHWFLPTGGDGAHVGAVINDQARTAAATERAGTVEYLSKVGRAAERGGFVAALTPVGAACADPFTTCAMVAQHTERLRFLVAFRPAFALPGYIAQQAQTFARLTEGRIDLNVVTGGDPVEQRAYGDFLDHDQRYERTDEHLEVLGHLLRDEPKTSFDRAGTHLRVEGAQIELAWEHPGQPPVRRPLVYFGGASPAAERVAARHADVYLAWGEPLATIKGRAERMAKLAADEGREVRIGLRIHVIARDTHEQAWAEAERLLAGMDASAVAASRERFARMDSVGQARMAALNADATSVPASAKDLELEPGLWAGVGLVREGAGTALVGTYDEVAERLHAYADAGVDELILSGWPHLEEAERLGQELLPLL